jgi:hypothetical protein
MEEETSETEQCTCIITLDSTNSSLIIKCTADIPDFDSLSHLSAVILLNLYLSASNQFHVPQNASMVFTPVKTTASNSFPSYITSINSTYLTFVATFTSLLHRKFGQLLQSFLTVFALSEISSATHLLTCQN